MNTAEAYEDFKTVTKKLAVGSPSHERNELILDAMEEGATKISAEDADGFEFADGSVYLIDEDASFETMDDAADYVRQARYEAESDARDLNETADYFLGRTGL